MGATTSQWQIPIGLQLVPGGILGLGMLLTKESTRWLAKTGKIDEARKSLIWVRGGEDTTEVREEYGPILPGIVHTYADRRRFAEIIAGIHEEERATEGFTWKEAILPANRYRFIVVITLQIGTL